MRQKSSDLETDLHILGGLLGSNRRYGHETTPELERQLVYAKIHRVVRQYMADSPLPLTDNQQIEILHLLKGGNN